MFSAIKAPGYTVLVISNHPKDNRKFNVIKEGPDDDGTVSFLCVSYSEQCSKAENFRDRRSICCADTAVKTAL